MKKNLAAFLAAAALALCLSPAAKAITISVSAVNSTGTSFAGPTADRAAAHGLSVTDAGGSTPDAVSASVNGATRYFSNAAADRPIAISGGTARATINSDYTVTVTVTPDLGATTYELIVATSILGELTLLDDIAGTQSTAALVTDVTGRLNGVITGGLGISGIAQTFSTGTGVNLAEQVNIAGSNSLNLGTFSGPQVFTLRYTFTTEAQAPQSGLGADEAAARFGATGPLGGATADDYPGPGDVVDRTQANDGHFVTVTANVLTVPEPSTFVMAGLGVVGLCLATWRRRAG
jgi:hypothetical protein